MRADPHFVVLDRARPFLSTDARLTASERQSLALGSVRLERVRQMTVFAGGEAGTCWIMFRPALSSGGLEVGVAGLWAASVARECRAEPLAGGEIISLAFPERHLSRGPAAHMRSGAMGPLPIRGAALMCLELSRACLFRAGGVSPAVAEALGHSLAELAELAIIEQGCAKRGETVRETMCARIRAFIHRNLADPDLTIERIAERMQCTKRYLHKVFSEEGETLNQYIWSRRLDLCRKHLSQPEMADKSITEIAFACGFSNAAHFSRSFRARFGQAPRSFRRAVLEQARPPRPVILSGGTPVPGDLCCHDEPPA